MVALIDQPTREQVEHRRHIQPSFRRPDICEVSDPFAVGRGSLEGAIEHVAGGLAGPARPSAARCDAGRTISLGKHVAPHPTGAVGPIGGEKAHPHLCAHSLVAGMRLRLRCLSVPTAIRNAAADTLEVISCALNQREIRSVCGAIT